MKPGRRTLVGADGSLLGVGEKLGVHEGLHRVSNETRRVYDAWSQARVGTALPRLDGFNIDGLGGLVDTITLVDVLAETNDYRYRRIGRIETIVRGNDPTGRTVRQCHEGEILDFVLENYDRATHGRDGLLDFSVDIDRAQRYITTEVMFLPFADDGSTVDHILVYTHYRDTGKAAL